MRQRTVALVLAAVSVAVCSAAVEAARTTSPIISRSSALQYGLTRAWSTQVQLDRTRSKLSQVLLYEGTVYVQSDRGMIHALDAETGGTRWVRQVGQPDHPSTGLDAFGDLLGVVNGSTLYVVNRYTGRTLLERQVDGSALAAPTLSSQWAYVGTINGKMLAYRLEAKTNPAEELGMLDEEAELTATETAAAEVFRQENVGVRPGTAAPLSLQSDGHIYAQAVVASSTAKEEHLAWPTDRGFLFVGSINARSKDQIATVYRMATYAEIASRPVFLAPNPHVQGDEARVFVTSIDGYVYSVYEDTGEVEWRFATGDPLVEPAVVVDPYVFATTQLGGMYCLNLSDGQEVWWTPQVTQFIAASKDRVYGTDKLGRLLVLDIKTGGRMATMEADLLPVKYMNMANDRILLATRTGLVQCLHEVELTEPIRHNANHDEDAPPPEVQQVGPGEAPAGGGEGGPKKPGPPAGQPGGAAPSNPFGDPPAGQPGGAAPSNPFGDPPAGQPGGAAPGGPFDNPPAGQPGGAAPSNPFGNPPAGQPGGAAPSNPFGNPPAGQPGGAVPNNPFGD